MARFDLGSPVPLAVGAEVPEFTLRHTFESSFSRPAGTPLAIAFYVFDFGRF